VLGEDTPRHFWFCGGNGVGRVRIQGFAPAPFGQGE